MQKSSSEKIKHVVVLMFENRSFDHILGAMPGVNGVLENETTVKPGVYNYLDPLNPTEISNFMQIPFPITPGHAEAAYISGSVDFDHDLDAMFTNLYGPGTTGVIKGEPQNNPWPTYPNVNPGFVNINYENTGQGTEYPARNPTMSYFKWKEMKVFHALAEDFVVCDNWFCDMPGHTAPNRAFMHCATTGDLGVENTDAAREPRNITGPMVGKESIFERLESFGNTWKMYVPGGLAGRNNLDTDFLNCKVSQQQYDPADLNQTNCTGVPLEQFCVDVKSGNLPTYSFIMCFDQGKNNPCMHPNNSVQPGEGLLASVYNELRKSDHWEDTLLVVNFDENGGIYDHVRPPRTVPPYPDQPAQQVKVWDQQPGELKTYTFDFSILGFRVPVILISPWLQKGIESQQLQNTSVLRFLQDHFCAPVPPFDTLNPPTSYLTQRDRFANSIQTVFDNFGLDAPRTDCPEHMHSTKPYDICHHNPIPDEILQAAPEKHMLDLTLEYISPLPGHPDSGRIINREFETLAELLAYVLERRNAATAHCTQQNTAPSTLQ